MGETLLISDVARLLGLTLKALRHYEKMGLVVPRRSPGSGYREYNADDIVRLKRIQQLQNLGLALKQIRMVLRDQDNNVLWNKLLETLLEDTEAEIDRLEERRQRIEELLAEGIQLEELMVEEEMVEVLLNKRGDPEMALHSAGGLHSIPGMETFFEFMTHHPDSRNLMEHMQDLQSLTIISSGNRPIKKEEYTKWPIVSSQV